MPAKKLESQYGKVDYQRNILFSRFQGYAPKKLRILVAKIIIFMS